MADYPICSQASWLELFLEQKLNLPMQSASLSEQVKLCSGDGSSVSLPSHLLLASSKLARRTFVAGEAGQDVLLPSVRGSTLLELVEILSSGMTSNLSMKASMGDNMGQSLRDIREVMELLDIPGCVSMMRVQNKIKSEFYKNVEQTQLCRNVEDMVPTRMKVDAELKLEIEVEVGEGSTETALSGTSKEMVDSSTKVQNKIKGKFSQKNWEQTELVRNVEDMAPSRMKVDDELKLDLEVDVDEECAETALSSKAMVDISTKAGQGQLRECHVCKQMYPTWKSWTSHFRLVHREAMFQCIQCGKKFVLEKTLEDHVYREHGGDGIGCEYCHFTYRNRELLNAHKYRRHRAEMISCRFCNMRFIHKDTLKNHIKKNHKQEQFQLRKRESRLRPLREKYVFSEKVAPASTVKKSSLTTENVAEVPSADPFPQKLPSENSSTDQHLVPPSPALDSSNPELSTTDPMTFYPTLEELANFEGYVAFMESQGAHKAGIARIVPPKEWIARKAGYEPSEIDILIHHPVQQNIATTSVLGAFTTFADRSIPPFTLPEYHNLANSLKYITPSHSSHEELEQLYWEQHQNPRSPSPIYGADIPATLTDPDQAVFNLTKLPSLISGMAEKVPGIHQPYVFFGMWKATFSWHVEDMDLYAINFLHWGAPKTWYCVPPQFGYKLEQLAHKLYPDMSDACFNLLRHKVVMIGPELLRMNGIPVKKMIHEQGTIMVVFPHAYHSGFNHGFNMAETLNFAIPRWVDYGKRFRGCLCRNQKREVRFDMEQFVMKLQPDKLEMWKKGEDFALHPEDPEFMKKYWEDMGVRLELGFINKEEFEELKGDLILKREIAPWFKKKFPLGYTDQIDSLVPEELSKDPLEENVGKFQFKDSSDLYQFVSRSQEDGRFYCNLCDKFSHPARNCTRDHVESRHYPNTFSYHCYSCDLTVDTKGKLKYHKYVLHK